MNRTTLDPATMVLHELRGPLGLMATAARSAADDCQDADLRGRCEMIVRAAESMLRTTNQVFQLNRALQAETAEPFLPAAVAADVTDTFRALGVLVRFESCAASSGATCFGVREGFEALLHSLLSNAVDHADPGTLIRASGSAAGGEYRVRISNVAAAGRRHQGLGLGTPIAAALAERLGGTLERRQEAGVYHATLRVPLQAVKASPQPVST